MSLRSEARLYFEKHLFNVLKDESKFRVLVVDELATSILSSCFKMHEITDMGIALIENVFKKRQPLPLEAVYLLELTPRTLEIIKEDFSGERKRYACAHIFTIRMCSETLIREVAYSQLAQHLRTFQELEYAFLPIESHIFSLDDHETGMKHPNWNTVDASSEQFAAMADRLTTLCQTLNEFPRICYQNGSKANQLLATMVKEGLIKTKSVHPSLGQGPYKDRSVLMILDRSIDLVSPLLHELTLQAMVYDIEDSIQDDVFTVGHGSTLDLLDRNEIWADFRHTHIADIENPLNQRIEEFKMKQMQVQGGGVNEQVPTTEQARKIKDFKKLINQAWSRELKKEQDTLAGLQKLTKNCLSTFRNTAKVECELEQDLAMGIDINGAPIRGEQAKVAAFLGNDTFPTEDKIRVILLYLLTRDETEEATLDKLLKCGHIDVSCKQQILGLCKWFGGQLVKPNIDLLNPMEAGTRELKLMPSAEELLSMFPFRKWCLPAKGVRKDRWQDKYIVSRWSPYVMDLMELAIAGKLSNKAFTFLPSEMTSMVQENEGHHEPVGVSLRFKAATSNVDLSHASGTNRATSRSGNPSINEHVGPRLIVFFLGGFTFSEARSAYDLTMLCQETRMNSTDPSYDKLAADRSILGRMNRSTNDLTATKSLPNGGGMGWNWEVVLGGTHILTPRSFLADLSELSRADTGSPTKNNNANSKVGSDYTNLALQMEA